MNPQLTIALANSHRHDLLNNAEAHRRAASLDRSPGPISRLVSRFTAAAGARRSAAAPVAGVATSVKSVATQL